MHVHHHRRTQNDLGSHPHDSGGVETHVVDQTQSHHLDPQSKEDQPPESKANLRRLAVKRRLVIGQLAVFHIHVRQ